MTPKTRALDSARRFGLLEFLGEIARSVGRLLGRKPRASAPPGASLAERLDALAEGAALICRGRYVERSGRWIVVRDGRTGRELRTEDPARAARALRG